jgi:hypothetical protein
MEILKEDIGSELNIDSTSNNDKPILKFQKKNKKKD